MEHIPLAYITELHYPPTALPAQPLKELYLEISGAHGFDEFRLLPDNRGAHLQSKRTRVCQILTDKIVYKDEKTEHTIETFAAEVGSTVCQIRERIRIPVFISQGVVVRVLCPVHGNGNSNEYILHRLLGFGGDAIRGFGRPASGVGVRIVFPATRDRLNEYQVRVEPYFQDVKMLYLENVARFLQPPQTTEQVEANIRAAYDFLRAETTEFLEALPDRKT